MMSSPPTPVYSKSNPAGGASLSPKKKRLLILICALVVAGIAAGSIWGAVQSDQYTAAPGCVSVTLAGSMGGELIHKCGNDAKTLCHDAYVNGDQTSLAIRPACEKAGLTPAKVTAG